MKLARVVGTVVSTVTAPILEDRTLLLVDLVEPDGHDAGGYLIAVDTVGAGAGETVLVLDEGTSARQIVGAPFGPLRTVIVGIVDAVEGPATEPAAGSATEPPTAGTPSVPASGPATEPAAPRKARPARGRRPSTGS